MTGRMMSEYWGQNSLLGVVHFYERDLPAHVCSGHGRYAPASGRWWGELSRAKVPDAIGGLTDSMMSLHNVILVGAICLAVCKFHLSSTFSGASNTANLVTSDNPWEATTLDGNSNATAAR